MSEDIKQVQVKQVASNPSKYQGLWNISPASMQATMDLQKIFKTTHGMFAGVPIICKVDKCPYFSVCMVDIQFRIPGQRCPMETAAIIARYEMWCGHFDIDISGDFLKVGDLTDATLVRDLVDNEVQTLRAENRIAMNADFIGSTISQIDNKGKAYFEDTVTPEAEFKLTLQEKRYKIMQLLNSTRKDKAGIKAMENNPSIKAASILRKVAEAIKIDVDDMDFSTPQTITTPTVVQNGGEEECQK